MNYRFNNGDLQMHKQRIADHIKGMGNLKPSPKKAFLSDCDSSYYLDVEMIEESYYYSTKKERDEDYDKLKKMIKQLKS